MSHSPSPRPIINLDEVTIEDRPLMFRAQGAAAERFASRTGMVGTRIGARLLGYNITAVPPGKRAFPLHNHHANEEMFFVLEGRGELRVGAQRHPLRQGDFVACPPGGPELAHQIVNTGDTELKYLAVSTMQMPEVVEYPDSGKLACLSRQTQPDGTPRMVRHIARPGDAVDYWDGE